MVDWTIVASIVVGLSLFKLCSALGNFIYRLLIG